MINEEIEDIDLISSIRKGTIKLNFVPLFCGASFKNIGVPNLIDGIISYLPSPDDLPINDDNLLQSIKDNKPVAYIFKIQNNKERGLLFFVRIYSGIINCGDTLFNPRTKKRERIQNILKVYADKYERLDKVKSGDIVVFTGLKDSSTGDTLSLENNQITLEGLDFPEPVIFVKIEPRNAIDIEKFNSAKDYFLFEDPTIKIKEDNDTGETLVGGMGELHIEIFLERIKREYNVDIKSGLPQVVYRETPSGEGEYTYQFDKKISGNVAHAEISLSVAPLERGKHNQIINNLSEKKITPEMKKYIKKGVLSSLSSGPEGAYPVVDCKIEVKDINFDENRSNILALEAAANICTTYLLRNTGMLLLEPIMRLEIDTPSTTTGVVIGELQSRGGIILDILKKYDNDIIIAKAPLKKMFGYTTTLRSITQGKGNFSMEFFEFDKKSER